MKILWVKNDFLHPTDRGGQIRTLETLKRLHRDHEVHYVGYEDPAQPEGVARAGEYSTRAYPVKRPMPRRNTPAFFGQLARNLFSDLPLAVGRYVTPEMRAQIETLLARERFDSVVCDFLSVYPNFPDLSRCVLFQHNVETMIWRRHAENARGPKRTYFEIQAKRMFECEREACRRAAHVIAVSDIDADQMKKLFGVEHVSAVATGVDLDYFRGPAGRERSSDIVFVGSMEWLANIDGARWFVGEVLPMIRAARPGATLTLAGRAPVPEIRAMAEADPLIRVTGSVPDIRPYFWDARVSIVPLRIGGGTRLKIYEAMAAGAPVVATAVGAEGLAVENGRHILLADDAESFAKRCVELLDDAGRANAIAQAALALVTEKFSWDHVGRHFASILETACVA